MIVIATLVDKPANLGGLSRTCEIFDAGKLVVADLKVSATRIKGQSRVAADTR